MKTYLSLISHFSFVRHCELLIDHSLPGLRSRGYYGGVGSIEHCSLSIREPEVLA